MVAIDEGDLDANGELIGDPYALGDDEGGYNDDMLE